MKFELIGRKEIEDLAFGWYNPPLEKERAAFLEEHKKFLGMLSKLLNSLGSCEIDPYDNKADYILGGETDYVRTIIIVCFHDKAYSEELISSLHQMLLGWSVDYMLVIDGQRDSGRSFYICLEKSGVKAWAMERDDLHVFGL